MNTSTTFDDFPRFLEIIPYCAVHFYSTPFCSSELETRWDAVLGHLRTSLLIISLNQDYVTFLTLWLALLLSCFFHRIVATPTLWPISVPICGKTSSGSAWSIAEVEVYRLDLSNYVLVSLCDMFCLEYCGGGSLRAIWSRYNGAIIAKSAFASWSILWRQKLAGIDVSLNVAKT